MTETPTSRYPIETLDEWEDDGQIVENVAELERSVVGRRIASAEQEGGTFTLTLDDGRRVKLRNTDDCCAYTELEGFLAHPEMVEHVITGVGTTDGYTRWHIFADFGDVMELKVGWSCGNPFYYCYGFHILVEAAPDNTERTK